MRFKYSLVFLFIAFQINFLYAQCPYEAQLMDGPDYPVDGVAHLQIKDPSTKQLELVFSDDFSTKPGPDLDVYLSNTPKVDGNSLNLGRLKSVTGTQKYDVPAGIGVQDYKWVIVHCTQYNHFWGNGELKEVPLKVDLGEDIQMLKGMAKLDAEHSGSSYQWITGEMTQSISVSKPGIYWVQVTNQNGCIGADTISVSTSSGIGEETVSKSLNIFPNPVTGDFFYFAAQADVAKAEISIFNVLGERVYVEEMRNINGQFVGKINLVTFKAGYYFMHFIAGDRRITRKVIKQ